MNRLLILGIAAAVVILVAASSLFAVQQTQQVLITQFGQPIRVIREPGLAWKIPFIQSVISFDRRLLDFPAAGQEVILGDQRRLVVDTFTMYRITDPLRFYQTVGATEAGIRLRLAPIVSSALRNTLGNEPLLAVLSADRARIMGEIRQRVNSEARSFGIEVAGSPFADINRHGPAVTASDFGNNVGLVIGAEIERAPFLSLRDLLVESRVNGELAGSSLVPDCAAALSAAQFLFDLARRRSMDVRPGQWISSGALTGAHAVRCGDRFEAVFTGLGTVACAFAGTE